MIAGDATIHADFLKSAEMMEPPPPPAAQGHGAKEGVVTIIGTVTTRRA